MTASLSGEVRIGCRIQGYLNTPRRSQGSNQQPFATTVWFAPPNVSGPPREQPDFQQNWPGGNPNSYLTCGRFDTMIAERSTMGVLLRHFHSIVSERDH